MVYYCFIWAGSSVRYVSLIVELKSQKLWPLVPFLRLVALNVFQTLFFKENKADNYLYQFMSEK